MKIKILLLSLLLTFNFLFASFHMVNAQTLPKGKIPKTTLPNGWKLSPAGKMFSLGDLPLNLVISPDGKLAAITNNGQSDQSIQLFNIGAQRVVDSVAVGKAWLGLAFSGDGKVLYASGGNDNLILRYDVRKNKLFLRDSIILGKPWPVKISVGGLALDDRSNRLYAVTREDNSLYVVDTQSKSVLSKHPLGGEGFTCLLSPDQSTLYATCWGCDKVLIFNTREQKMTGFIPAGDNPNDLCITRDGRWLFIANANDNNVLVADTRLGKVVESLHTALYPKAPVGSTTNSVALSEDEKMLFIANADNNCLAVFDVSSPGTCKSLGFIPTGWYPTCVRVSGNKLLVANGKGITSMANPYGPNPVRRGSEVVHHEGGKEIRTKVQYIAGLLRGSLSLLKIPKEKSIRELTQMVFENTPYIGGKELHAEGAEGNPVPRKVGDPSPIKYVFYVIKENRTYDQVLGDLPQGNGDTSLVLFGEKITPNHHALAREFVLLDNFYVNGEVSADGHNWSMGAYATDYLEKTWPTSYGGRGGSYSAEGTREIANNKDGFLWDYCQRKGLSYRSYGEFVEVGGPNIPVLEGHYCTHFTPWDQSVMDTIRFHQWKRDFDSLMAIQAVPRLNTIRIINDHTEGLKLGRPTPFAHVADNDLAVGMMVDYLSHSPIWKESLVVIVEDDAQNGPDHVDAHRSLAFLAGGYVKKGFVDSTPYTTASLLRTMELILGLPPMSQYDAAATPLWRCFEKTPDHPVFNVRPCQVDLSARNQNESAWQQMSETFDFSKEDQIDDLKFNEVIWKAVKGLDSTCPPAVRAAFFFEGETEED
ncbi:MAG TPA: bifunctional YncE family protein/alkaline phosphatase family protein [Prolixibacteraceae bacterium]|nr:bifunctional YncE family protein/alkaline phosphatase family protein [Prolixibacteraceae bacterium]